MPLIYRIVSFVVFAAALFVVQLPFSHAAGVVATCDEASLDAALAGGGTITFACSGTITITSTKTISTDTTIDGDGQNVTISGGGALQIFALANNITFEIRNLTIADGFSANSTGAISGEVNNAVGIVVNINNSVFTNNHGEIAGVVAFVEEVTIDNSTFSNNSGQIGVIWSITVTISNSTFTHNAGIGPGVTWTDLFTITNSSFSYNTSENAGGVILTHFGGVINDSSFTNNSSSRGGAIFFGTFDESASLIISDSIFANNSASVGAALFIDMFNSDIPTIIFNATEFLNNDCVGPITDGGGNSIQNSPGCPGIETVIDVSLPPPPQCQEMLDPAFAAPVGTYCQVLMRNGSWLGYPGTIPGELVEAGVIIALEVIYYDLPGHASQTFSDGGNQQVCLQGDGRFIYLSALQSPRQIVEMNTVYENGYTCAWIPNPGTVVLIER